MKKFLINTSILLLALIITPFILYGMVKVLEYICLISTFLFSGVSNITASILLVIFMVIVISGISHILGFLID